MGKFLQPLLSGIALGAISWFVVPLVSNKLEPYDSGAGLWIGQALMATAAFHLGSTRRITSVVVFVSGAYVGLNLYPYVFGGPEQRAWASLGLVVSTLLCAVPLLAGLAGNISKCRGVETGN